MPPPRLDRERLARLARPVVPDRTRGPAVVTAVAGVGEVAAVVERHLAQARRHRAAIGLVCVSVECVDSEAVPGTIEADLERLTHDEVMQRVCARVRGSDTVLQPNARDACVILPGATEEAVRRVGARLLRALNGAYQIGGQVLHVSVHVGSAAHPADGAHAPDLLRRATGW